MIRPFKILLFVLLTNAAVGQEQPIKREQKQEEEIQVLEEMPEFPGGAEKMDAFIKEHLQYPAKQKEQGISGKVVVRFAVLPDGSLADFSVARGLGSPELEAEAIRILKLMSKWNPAKRDGKPIATYYKAAIDFSLQ